MNPLRHLTAGCHKAFFSEEHLQYSKSHYTHTLYWFDTHTHCSLKKERFQHKEFEK